MKRKIVIIAIASALAASMLLGGCGSRSSETSATSETSSLQEEDREFKTDEILGWIDYDPAEYVTLPDDYMKIDVKLYQDDYKVTDDAVNEYIETNILTYYPTYHTKDKKKTVVETGDTVNIDYTGKVDGKEFDGGSATGSNLKIGSGTFIDGFEDGLVGKKVGDTVTLNLTFPDDYSDSKVAGKDVVFEVKINYIGKEKTIKSADKLNDAWVSENLASMGYTTVDGLVEYVRSILENQAESAKNSELSEQILDYLDKNSKVDVPDSMVDTRVERSMKEIEEAAKKHAEEEKAAAAESSAKEEESKEDSEDPVEHYLQENYGMTKKEYEKQMRKDLPDIIKQDLILQAIIKDQKVSFQGSDYNTWIQNIMSNYYMTDLAQFYEQFESYGGRDYLLMQYAESQALSKVAESANIKEMLGASPEDSEDAQVELADGEDGKVEVEEDSSEAAEDTKE